jgi:hypothetical protein
MGKEDKKSLFNLTAITGRLSLFILLGMLRFLIFTVHVELKNCRKKKESIFKVKRRRRKCEKSQKA